MSLLDTFITGQVFAFLLIFMRIGMALMIMPGIGDSFVSPQIRLLFALAMSFVLTPVLAPNLPAIPSGSFAMVSLLMTEALVGIFIGTIMRILISALDTAGMVVSMQSGFNNAMIFSPIMDSQGSLMGALYAVAGVVLLLITNLHHLLLASIVESYQLFPANGILPDTGSLSEVIVVTVSHAFQLGVKLAIPFIIVGTLVYFGFGLLGRLMPQVQIFFLALPAQILISLITLSMVFSIGLMYWLRDYDAFIVDFMTQ